MIEVLIPVKNIFIFALSAALIISWSLIDPPGWIIVFTPVNKDIYPISEREKGIWCCYKFLIFEDWNCFAFCTAILQLSKRLGCPAPMPIVEKLLHNTIAFDLTCLETLKANLISANSFLVGFNLVTHFNFFISIIILSLDWTKKDPSKDLIEIRFLSLKLEISIKRKFFFSF